MSTLLRIFIVFTMDISGYSQVAYAATSEIVMEI